jgi:hypothetical protein
VFRRGQGRRCLLSVVVTLCTAAASAAPTPEEIQAVYREILPGVRLDRIRTTYQDVSAFGSRITGSTAERKTFDYAEAQMRALGLQSIRREPFKVTIPDPDATGTLTIGARQVQVLPLWPNLARTSTCDVQGRLLYGRNGTLESLSGKDVAGSIVVLEFDSGARWRNAAKLGAKAVVFLQPDEMTRPDAETKFSAVPLDVPRFYLPLKNAAPVLNAAMREETVSLRCRQDWVQRESYNLIGELPGSDPKVAKEPIAVFAYADAMSVVPGAAPGAEGISGVAGLLETARVFKDRKHRRPLQFVLSGGHGIGLQGAREFIERRIDTRAPSPFLMITLDLTSGAPTIGSYGRGWYYEYRDELQTSLQGMSRTFRAHIDRLAPVMGVTPPRLVLVDAVNNGDSRTWKNNISGKFAFDCEPLVTAGMNALTFGTVEDSRQLIDTPFDTLDRVNFANVRRQVQTLACMLHHALNDTTNRNEGSDHKIPLDPPVLKRMSLIGGFATLDGQVVSFDPTRSFVPDTPVVGSMAALLHNQKTMMGVRGDLLKLTEGPKAQYRFIGAAPINAYPAWGGPPETRLAAFRVDQATGRIDYAPSLGTYGDFRYPIEFELKVVDRTSPIVVFPCVATNLFDLVDPQELKAIPRVRVFDATTGTLPQDFGIFSPGFDQRLSPEIEDAQVLFTSPGQRYMLLGGLGEVRLILTNSTDGDETGKGYVAPGGKPVEGRQGVASGGTFPNTALNTARDIVGINETRLRRFTKYRIISQGVRDLQSQAVAEIRLAEAAQASKDWAAADRHARAAWGFALRAHPVIMTTANDVVNGVVFYLFLLIPFSYFLERLLVGSQLLTKQLAWSCGLFMASFVLLRLIHPAFEIVTNPTMIFVAFVMGVLSLIVISFILGKFETSLKAIRAAQSGVHEVDIRRSSVAMAAFNLGVSNMRRRKARTFLTTLTLVVMTFIVLSFTSIVSDLSLNEEPSDNPSPYSGILIRNPGMEPLQLTTFRTLANEFEGRAQIVRRAYYYGADIGDNSVLTLQRADRVAEVRAMVGLEPAEKDVLRPQEALLPGGRWFRPDDTDVMILPQPLAEQLKVEPSEVGKAKVTYAGVSYTVIGIADPAVLRGGMDLDGDNFLPPDFTLSRRQQEQSASTTQAFRKYIRLDPATVFIVPTQTALGLGADLRTVAVRFENPEDTRKALDSLMPRLRLNLYASVPSKSGGTEGNGLEVRQFSVFQGSKSSGMGLILVQLVIASVFVLNTMVATVYERTKEIGIFSSIGLAPNHIAMLFFAESLVYGVLGAVIGYFVAQASAKVIVATGALQGLTLNFSSTSAVMSAVLVMGVVLLSTIYPARKASQIAAPAMNEEVFETEPEGDVWDLPLPFSIGANEAGPLSIFLGEWLKAYEGYTIGDFVTKDTKTATLNGDGPNPTYTVEAITWLAPYDLGVSQHLLLRAHPSPVPGVYMLDLTLTRLAGDPENWPVVNRRFLANVRKQFLTWRTLDREQRARYSEMLARGVDVQDESVAEARSGAAAE